MTLIEPAETYTYDYWQPIIDELGLEDEFEAVTGEPYSEDYDLEISEIILLEDILKETEDRYILNVALHNPEMYLIILLDDED